MILVDMSVNDLSRLLVIELISIIALHLVRASPMPALALAPQPLCHVLCLPRLGADE